MTDNQHVSEDKPRQVLKRFILTRPPRLSELGHPNDANVSVADLVPAQSHVKNSDHLLLEVNEVHKTVQSTGSVENSNADTRTCGQKSNSLSILGTAVQCRDPHVKHVDGETFYDHRDITCNVSNTSQRYQQLTTACVENLVQNSGSLTAGQSAVDFALQSFLLSKLSVIENERKEAFERACQSYDQKASIVTDLPESKRKHKSKSRCKEKVAIKLEEKGSRKRCQSKKLLGENESPNCEKLSVEDVTCEDKNRKITCGNSSVVIAATEAGIANKLDCSFSKPLASSRMKSDRCCNKREHRSEDQNHHVTDSKCEQVSDVAGDCVITKSPRVSVWERLAWPVGSGLAAYKDCNAGQSDSGEYNKHACPIVNTSVTGCDKHYHQKQFRHVSCHCKERSLKRCTGVDSVIGEYHHLSSADSDSVSGSVSSLLLHERCRHRSADHSSSKTNCFRYDMQDSNSSHDGNCCYASLGHHPDDEQKNRHSKHHGSADHSKHCCNHDKISKHDIAGSSGKSLKRHKRRKKKSKSKSRSTPKHDKGIAFAGTNNEDNHGRVAVASIEHRQSAVDVQVVDSKFIPMKVQEDDNDDIVLKLLKASKAENKTSKAQLSEQATPNIFKPRIVLHKLLKAKSSFHAKLQQVACSANGTQLLVTPGLLETASIQDMNVINNTAGSEQSSSGNAFFVPGNDSEGSEALLNTTPKPPSSHTHLTSAENDIVIEVKHVNAEVLADVRGDLSSDADAVAETCSAASDSSAIFSMESSESLSVKCSFSMASENVVPSIVNPLKRGENQSAESESGFKKPGLPLALFKKPSSAIKLGLRITDASAAAIANQASNSAISSSKRVLEEGELSDSGTESDDSSHDECALNTLTANCSLSFNVDEIDSSGSLTDSDDNLDVPLATDERVTETAKVQKKHRDRKKHKKHKRTKQEKSGKKDRSKKDKRKETKEKSVRKRKFRCPSRSRSRSFSVMRKFDTKNGVWRMRKPHEIRASLASEARLRPLNDLRIQIDKQRLREIAVQNAYKNMKSGQGPAVKLKATELAKVTGGGKSIEELTDLCRSLLRSRSYDSDDHSNSDDDDAVARQRTGCHSDDDSGDIFFTKKLKTGSNNIIVNIPNARQIPVLSKEEKAAQNTLLRVNFPISSGMRHRAFESEWVPVEKETPKETAKPVCTESQPTAEKTFTAGVNVKNIGQIVSERLNALRQLSSNPNNIDAINAAQKAEQQLQQWALSKKGCAPIGVCLPPKPRPLFKTVYSKPPVLNESVGPNSGSTSTPIAAAGAGNVAPIGRLLLQKMGWKEGEGLGKHNSGPTAPLELDMKMDRKGLDWVEPRPVVRQSVPVTTPAAVANTFPDLAKLHPVSALMEICVRKRWMQPIYELVEEHGPAHRKCFKFKVIVDGVEYEPACSSGNKKAARSEAAIVCLQQLSSLPIFRAPCNPVPRPTPLLPARPTGFSHTLARVQQPIRPATAAVFPRSSPATPVSLLRPSVLFPSLGIRPLRPPAVPSLVQCPFGFSEIDTDLALAEPDLGIVNLVEPNATDFTEDYDLLPAGSFWTDAGFEEEEDDDDDPFAVEHYSFDPTQLPTELFRPRTLFTDFELVNNNGHRQQMFDEEEYYEEEDEYVEENDDQFADEWFGETPSNFAEEIVDRMFEPELQPLLFNPRPVRPAGQYFIGSDRFRQPRPMLSRVDGGIRCRQQLPCPRSQRLELTNTRTSFIARPQLRLLPPSNSNVQFQPRVSLPAANLYRPPVRPLLSVPARPVFNRPRFFC